MPTSCARAASRAPRPCLPPDPAPPPCGGRGDGAPPRVEEPDRGGRHPRGRAVCRPRETRDSLLRAGPGLFSRREQDLARVDLRGSEDLAGSVLRPALQTRLARVGVLLVVHRVGPYGAAALGEGLPMQRQRALALAQRGLACAQRDQAVTCPVVQEGVGLLCLERLGQGVAGVLQSVAQGGRGDRQQALQGGQQAPRITAGGRGVLISSHLCLSDGTRPVLSGRWSSTSAPSRPLDLVPGRRERAPGIRKRHRAFSIADTCPGPCARCGGPRSTPPQGISVSAEVTRGAC